MKYNLPLKKWALSSFLGWMIGITIVVAIAVTLNYFQVTNLHFFMGLVIGVTVGYIQWQMLYQIIPIDKKWVWYSALGLTLPFLTFDLLPYFTRIVFPSYQLSIPIMLGALSIGALQAKLLKPFSRKADLWLVACIFSWGGAGFFALCGRYASKLVTNTTALYASQILLIVIAGIVLGLISGFFLKKMLFSSSRNSRKIKKD